MMIYHERFKLRHVNNLLHDELHFLLRLLWDILGCSATSQFLTLFHWVVWILLVSVMQNPLWERNKHKKKKTLLNIGRQNPPQTSRCELKLTIIKPKPLKINYPGQTKRIFKSWKISTNKSPYISLIIGWENLLAAMIFKNLIFISIDYVPKFFGQNWCWTLLVLKG